jgi:hypothetical protein
MPAVDKGVEVEQAKARSADDCGLSSTPTRSLNSNASRATLSFSPCSPTMATPLRLPETLPYPIRINSLDSSVNELVKRGKRLLTYSFTAPRRRGEDDAPPEMRFGTWDAPVEGTIEQWRLQRNQIVDLAWARRETVVLVKEPCTHAIQMGGLCGLCGKDMTMCVTVS